MPGSRPALRSHALGPSPKPLVVAVTLTPTHLNPGPNPFQARRDSNPVCGNAYRRGEVEGEGGRVFGRAPRALLMDAADRPTLPAVPRNASDGLRLHAKGG
eukprot:scaffold90296_cov68-Phaeocystis_antarctica.AAC.8